ncbi:hypothetical protein DUNSADRAFT_17114 [Dunaliella salina]|uniref:Uncharacterized protein n=1 Tax=Dunaliella salina TaxID=3046 RepID=A0ABQ7G2D8_DUNSA|nr:hypothetical protein DUNSADRAFT_17114 [Dunaliella salina]|eukprot:KAF5828767.1 hypothetical protein DUNSADRAFT_17114 [Dunaliella salina]
MLAEQTTKLVKARIRKQFNSSHEGVSFDECMDKEQTDSAAGSQQGGQHAQSKSNNSQSYSGDDDQAGSTSKRESGQHAQPNNNQSYSGDDDQAGSASELESGQHAHAQPQGSPARAAAAAAAAAAAERTPGDSGADLGEDSNYSSDEELPEPTAPRASHHSDRPMQDGSDGSKRESSGLHAAHAPGAEAPELQQQQQQQAEDRASGDGEGDGSDEDKDDDLFGDDEESGQEQPGGQEHAPPSHQPSVTNSFDRSPSPTTQSLLNSDLPAHLEAPAQPAQPQGPSTASDKGQEGPGEEAHSGTAAPQNADTDEQARTPVQEQQQKEQQHEQQHEQHDQQHEHEQQQQHQQQQQQQQQHEPPSATDNNHVINRHPERFAKPGDDPTLDYTFQPRIRPASHRILKEANCQQGAFGSTFMDRLEGDAKRREVNRMEAERRCYAPEALLRQSKLAKDTKVVNQLLMDVAMAQLSRDEQEDKALVAKTLEKARLSSRETEYEAQIDRAVEEHSQGWEMDVHQVRNVLSLRGPKKVAALAGVVRTAQFMHRYTSELSTRDERLQSLQRAWWEKYMGNPKQQKEAEDMRQAFEYYSLMGWKGEDAVTDDRLLKLRVWDELRKAETWSGPALQLGLYRMIRTQRFIDFTEKNIQAKEQKMRETYESLKPKSRVLSKEQVDGFYERLLDDAAKRNETKMKLVQEKLHKEHHVVGSSNMFKKRK